MSRLLLANAPWVMVVFLVGCSGKGADPGDAVAKGEGPPVVITRLQVTDATPSARRPTQLPVAGLEASLVEALAAVGIRRGKPGSKAWRIRMRAQITYGLTTGEGLSERVVPGTAKAVWGVEMRLVPPDSSTAMYAFVEGAAEAPFKGVAGALPALLEGRVKQAATSVAESVGMRARLLGRDVPGLVQALTDADSDTRRAAAGRLGMLRAKAAVPALAAGIRKEKDREALLRMVGALQEIGDDAAASALISLADPRDRELLRAIVNALAVVGGERVSDFLDILGTHDAADIRELVAQARARLKSRR